MFNEGWVTRGRLALARVFVWSLWNVLLFGTKVLLREEHPFRVYIKGATDTVLPCYLESLRIATGPRVSQVTKLKLGLVTLVPAAFLAPTWCVLFPTITSLV